MSSMSSRELKILRDKFVDRDGLVHIEVEKLPLQPFTNAVCGLLFTSLTVEYVPDTTNVTCMDCIAKETDDG